MANVVRGSKPGFSGVHGSVWGLNAAGLIFRFNPNAAPPAFQQINGQLAQIAVGADGSVWGLNGSGLIFRFNPSAAPPAFQEVNGQLAQIAVGADGSVWGLNGSGLIFRFNPNAAPPAFQQVNGQLAQIAVGADGSVWGLNGSGLIFRFNPNAVPPAFQEVNGQLAQIAVGADGSVWGLNGSGLIFRFNPSAAPPAFQEVSGQLAQIAVGADGSVWGLNASGLIFRFNPSAAPPAFQEVSGQLGQITVNADGSVWGLNASGLIFRFNPSAAPPAFEQINGQLSQISGAPLNTQTLAAHQAISARYESLGGPSGRLGAITSSISFLPLSQSFVQSYRGGKLIFDTTSDTVSLTNGVLLRISYQGINCFGNPGGVANSDAYGIIQLLGVEQKLLKTTKVSEDGTDDLYKSLEAGESSTQGQISWIGTAADAPIPPQTLTLSSTVFHTGILGANSEGAKDAMASALGKVAQEFVGLFGLGILADTAGNVGQAVGNAIGDVLSLSDVRINTVNKTFTDISQLTALPPSDSLTEGGITHNFASDLITNQDASYKMYFNVEVLAVNPVQAGP